MGVLSIGEGERMGYARPTGLSEALGYLAGTPGAVVLAGGTDLYPAISGPSLRGPVLDITAIAGLRGITREPHGWRIGALTTWSAIRDAALPPVFDALRAAAREVGAIQIQNSGTIGGNLCNASPAADGVPPLMVLDAGVELTSIRGVRRLALADFLTGPRQTARAPDEVLTHVLIPDLPGQSGFCKLGARRYLVISIVMAAARIACDGVIREAALCVGAASAVALRLPGLERAVIGLSPADAAGLIRESDLALVPLDDIRASAVYRQEAAREMLARAVLAAT